MKRFKILVAILMVAIPIGVQAIPTGGEALANLLTFATFTVNINVGAGLSALGPAAYSPDTITINSGDTVIWQNTDANTHTATCGSGIPCGQWDTGLFTGPGTFSAPIAFSSFAIGTTGYFCDFHGYPAMYGAVIRNAPTSIKGWEKYSSAEKAKAMEVNPIRSAFGMTFVSSNDLTSASLTGKVSKTN